MSKSPLQGSLAKQIGKAFAKSLFYSATLTRTTTRDGPAWDPGSGTTTTTDYPCKAIEDEYSVYERQNTLIEANDRKVLVLATTLSVTPSTSDQVMIRGTTYAIVNVSTDPAQAVWVCQCRS